MNINKTIFNVTSFCMLVLDRYLFIYFC